MDESNILIDLLRGLGTIVDTPGSIARGLLGGNADAAFGGIFDPERRLSGRDVLESWGALDANMEGLDGGDIAGFGVELLFDPMNLIGGFGLLKTAKGAKAAKGFNAERAILEASNLESQAMRASGAFPAELIPATKIVDEFGMPKKMYHGTATGFEGPYDLDRLDPKSLFGRGIYATDSQIVAGGESGYWTKSYRGDRRGLAPDEVYDKLQSGDLPIGDFLDELASSGYVPREEFVKSYRPLAVEQFPVVNMHYIASKRPYDMERLFSPEEVNDVLTRVGRKSWQYDPVQLELWKSENPNWTPDTLGTKRGEDIFWQISEGDAEKGRRLLEDAGYDSIVHRGGGRVGDIPHNVAIAFRPDQVFNSFIAPPLIPVPPAMRVPNMRPIFAALAAQNAIRPFHNYSQATGN